MRVLVAPMGAMAETSGPFSRASALCKKLIERGHTAAFCAALDVNYHSIENVKNYYAPVPSPMGLPMAIGKRMFKMAQMLGVQQKKKVNSFEQVLHFVGATNYRLFSEDVLCIRKAIRDFKPDVVYAEFRISAVAAAKLENIKVVTGYSYPVQKSFACNPEYSKGVREFILQNNLPAVESALEIFDWADLKVVPSSYELEPIEGNNVVFTGPFSSPCIKTAESSRNKIIAYMGSGTITPKSLIENLTEAFEQSNYQIYIATEQVKPFSKNNINVDKRFNFSEIMPEAAAFINHGGQNSIMTGLIYGVPQIVCPGIVFERRYNASSIVNLGAGVFMEASEFNSKKIKDIFDDFNMKPAFAENSRKAGERLLSLGGAARAVQAIEEIYNEKKHYYKLQI